MVRYIMASKATYGMRVSMSCSVTLPGLGVSYFFSPATHAGFSERDVLRAGGPERNLSLLLSFTEKDMQQALKPSVRQRT